MSCVIFSAEIFPDPGENKPGLPLFGFPTGGNATENEAAPA